MASKPKSDAQAAYEAWADAHGWTSPFGTVLTAWQCLSLAEQAIWKGVAEAVKPSRESGDGSQEPEKKESRMSGDGRSELLSLVDGLFTLLAESIAHGMPVTERVANIRNKAADLLKRNESMCLALDHSPQTPDLCKAQDSSHPTPDSPGVQS